ncbi:MAG TPA: SpoIID/LytB domain-containing protein [Acidobacteriota bacterium]|nr:SpoIID/LytB domain-containing protein [Acidobacteriota bacterium]
MLFRLFLLFVGISTIACGDKPRVIQQPVPLTLDRPSHADTAATDQAEPAPSSRPAPAPSQIRLLIGEDFDRLLVTNSQKGEQIEVKATGGKIRIFQKQETVTRFLEEGSGFRFTASGAEPLKVQGVAYRGLVDIFINPLGTPVAVNEVDLESYLCGVVPNELGPVAFPYLEALKAQAVAARSFAASGLGTFASRGFDLYSDSRSQVYTGTGNEHPLSTQAVNETRGLILSFQGKPIAALYSSTCGGRTEDYSRVFSGKPLPYLRGGIECSDQLSPYHSWRTRVSFEDRADKMKARLAIDCLTDLKLLHRNEAGRVEAIQFVGRHRQETLRANDFRLVLGLRSNFIVDLDTQFDSRGCIRELNVQGKGWGHGVGLCQMGAVSMAQKGILFDDILDHYYPETTLTKLY